MSFFGQILGGVGDLQEAGAFREAARIEQGNVSLEKQITGVNTNQVNRQVFQALGSESAETGAAGVRMMGSGRALMQASAYQGALKVQAVKTQGIIQENAYAEQAAAYSGQAAAKNASGIGGIVGGVFSMAASMMGGGG